MLQSILRRLIPVLLGFNVMAGPAVAASGLVLAERGDLPVLILAPHGGSLPIPGVPPRTNGVVSQDSRTLELARATIGQLEKLCGHRPYLVAARFHRKYTDANRAERDALEHDAARPAYREYHARAAAFVAELRERFPRGALVLDVHGQIGDRDAIFRGTQNGLTVQALVRRAGNEAITGTNSVLGGLALRGVKIIPPNTPPGSPPENRRYNGGFTVRTYGSHATNGVDAIQLEFGSNLRTDAARREQVTRALAESVIAFGRRYLDWP